MNNIYNFENLFDEDYIICKKEIEKYINMDEITENRKTRYYKTSAYVKYELDNRKGLSNNLLTILSICVSLLVIALTIIDNVSKLNNEMLTIAVAILFGIYLIAIIVLVFKNTLKIRWNNIRKYYYAEEILSQIKIQ